MPRLLVEKGPDRGRSVTVVMGQQVVAGRDKAADLQLSDQMCSRRHFLVASKGSVFGLKDLGSANGTLVNGRKSEAAHRLTYGDSIQIGETLITWMPDDQDSKQGGLIGQQIGGYRIEERLGRGAMGTVYKATQLSLGRTVALKVLAPDLVKDEKFCDMFVKEARAAGSLNHPNIIQVYDVGDEKGQYYFSMEYASKGSVLEEMSKSKTLPLSRAVTIIRQACAALDYAERKGLVHRDVKPDNLMVTEDDTVKLGDLGLAMSTVELQAEQDGVFGTPHYIAPEQAMGKPIDHRADIYALGATFYRIVTGSTMFSGATVKEILKKQVREPHRPVIELVPDCPPAISTVIDRMLAKNPAERYQHASEIAGDLTDWDSLQQRKAVTDSSAFADRPRGLSPEASQQIAEVAAKRNLMFAAVAAVIAVGALVAVLWVFVFSDDPPAQNNTTVIAGNTNTAPANNTPPVDEDTRIADDELKAALGVANFLVGNPPLKASDYQQAIDALDKALVQWPKGSESMKDTLRKRRNALDEAMKALALGAAAVNDEWEDVRRAALAQVEDFKFKAARDQANEFIKKHEANENEEVKLIVAKATSWLLEGYITACQSALSGFEKRVTSEEQRSDALEPAERVSILEGLVKDVAAREEACDEETYKERLTRRRIALEGKLDTVRKSAESAQKLAMDQAYDRASRGFVDGLESSRKALVRGDFASAEKAIKDFETGHADYLKHKGHERFKPLAEDIARRMDQIKLAWDALRALDYNQTGACMPGVRGQNDLLKEHAWPEDAAKLFGGGTVMINIQRAATMGDKSFTITRVKDGKFEAEIAGSEFADAAKGKALATALTHLLTHDAEMRKRILMPVPRGSSTLPAGLCIYVLLTELEAYAEAYEFISMVFAATPKSDGNYALVREYYAWGLIGKAQALNAAGNRAEASKLLERVSTEFADTRAHKGRN